MENNKLRVFEAFAGFGGCSFALKRLKESYPNFEYEIVGYSEIDKFAIDLYNANHKDSLGNLIKNFGDINFINPSDYNFPDFDMLVGGFPCQPYSNIGLQLGKNDIYGRGNYLEQIVRICEIKKPKYILLENVKGFLSKKFELVRNELCLKLRELGYVYDKNDLSEKPIHYALLNSKDYGIPQIRERVWMFARLGGLPIDFNLSPQKQTNNLKLVDFLDPEKLVPKKLYLKKQQIEKIKTNTGISNFYVNTPLCIDIYNKRIKYDGYCITLTMPTHNSLRIALPNPIEEVVRKLTVNEQFRLMGLESLSIKNNKVDIKLNNQSYTQLSKRAANGWDVNLVTILFKHIFSQLKEFDFLANKKSN